MKSTGTSKSQFATLKQSNLVEEVQDRLMYAIAHGELQPGERLVEAELARQLGISRGPIREAARLLQERGIVTSEARRGFFVRRVSLREIENLADYRICLEAYAARKAVAQAKRSEIYQLRALYETVVEAENRRDEDPLAGLEAALDFHTHIFELSGNPRLSEAFQNLIVQIRQIATLVNIGDDENAGFFGKYLLRIVEAFEAGDPDEVARTVEKYLIFSRDQTMKFYIDHHHTD